MSALDFMDDALCAETDPDIFSPPKGGSTAAAIRICNQCDVRQQCLEYALANKVKGIWGATSVFERQKIRRSRKKAATE